MCFCLTIVPDIDGIIDLDHESLTYESNPDEDDDATNAAQYYIRLDKDGDHKLNRNPHIDLNAPLCYLEKGELVCEYWRNKVNIVFGKTMLFVLLFVCCWRRFVCLLVFVVCFIFVILCVFFWVSLLFLLSCFLRAPPVSKNSQC